MKDRIGATSKVKTEAKDLAGSLLWQWHRSQGPWIKGLVNLLIVWGTLLLLHALLGRPSIIESCFSGTSQCQTISGELALWSLPYLAALTVISLILTRTAPKRKFQGSALVNTLFILSLAILLGRSGTSFGVVAWWLPLSFLAIFAGYRLSFYKRASGNSPSKR
ncbi:MAG: hypothetical protein KDD42_06755 [Bdellovibrionales bacterium]|nr:hypothetical protein [Bdellovibrionales bacterium]